MKTLLIIYSGLTPNGSTATLAKWIKLGADSVSGIQVIIKEASTVDIGDVANADGIVCGSGDYNGNPEPPMINFFDNILKAGYKTQLTKISTMPFGVFATSAGYGTGAQEVLQSMARALLTFGGIYVGGGGWHISQGIVGMTQKTSDNGWDWVDKTGFQKYLQEDACEYGRRIAAATVSIPNNFNTALSNNPNKCTSGPIPKPTPSEPTPSDPTPSEKTLFWILFFIVVFILIFIGIFVIILPLLKKGSGDI